MKTKYVILNTYSLDQLFDLDKVISVIKVYSSFGYSLVIALKDGAQKHNSGPQFMHYGKPDPYTINVSLSKFTYSVPCNMAIPKEYWKDIKIMEKHPEGNLRDTFFKATITRKVHF